MRWRYVSLPQDSTYSVGIAQTGHGVLRVDWLLSMDPVDARPDE